MPVFDDPHRLRLAGMAAAGADVRPQLRLLMLAEALASPPARRALDLSAETAALCTAASEAVRRQSGWLYVVPSPAPLPVALPRNLWQAAVLCVLRGVQPAGRAVITLQPGAGAAVAVFRAVHTTGIPADTLPLLRRAAALTGGLCVTLDMQATDPRPRHFAAALRLPLAPHLPLREPSIAEDLLCDQYSALHVLLDGFTV